jgi:hypothetical protein
MEARKESEGRQMSTATSAIATAQRILDIQRQQIEKQEAEAEIARTCEILFPRPNAVTELRILKASTPTYKRPHVESGYFDDWKKLAQAATSIIKATGWYIIPNEVKPDLLARRVNRIEPVADSETTSDKAILRRRWFLVDVDAERDPYISSTDAEHEAALTRAREIRDWLAADGWPDPIYADSGNGAHLMYPIDMPTDDGGIINRCLKALGEKFTRDGLKVDSTVGNPARIWKLYGTPARKGDSTAERPHRMARILETP